MCLDHYFLRLFVWLDLYPFFGSPCIYLVMRSKITVRERAWGRAEKRVRLCNELSIITDDSKLRLIKVVVWIVQHKPPTLTVLIYYSSLNLLPRTVSLIITVMLVKLTRNKGREIQMRPHISCISTNGYHVIIWKHPISEISRLPRIFRSDICNRFKPI